MRGSRIRVLVVDDHPMVREMVRTGCEQEGMEVVGEAATGEQALEECRRLSPDVTVLDLILPGLDGLAVLQAIGAEGIPTRVLVLTNRGDHEAVFESMRLGALGYLEKTVGLDDIVAAIRAVASGRHVFTPEQERMAKERLGEMARRARTAAAIASRLTKRERQVLELIARGLTTRQVASRLGVSERTVESHIANLYEKLEVRTRLQAVHRAASLGLVDLQAP